MSDPKHPTRDVPDPGRSDEERERRLDEELDESFPASDPTSPGSVLPVDPTRSD